jgi:uncharacterized protein (DUF1800 family)
MIGLAGAYNRFGLGPRPGDLAANADIRAALRAELEIDGIAMLSGPGLLDAGAALIAYAQDQQQRRQALAGQAAAPAMEPAPGAAAMAPADAPPARNATMAAQQSIYLDEIGARLRQFRAVEVGFVERLVAFWTNHFAIEAGAGGFERTLVGAFEREAIRPYVLGRFRDMLGAATKHPAMLSYLDNAQSVGPNSRNGLQAGRGLNENHARELLELHTVGVDAGYTQADVTAMARILTGWAFVGRGGQAQQVGSFVFRTGSHEPGVHTVMGVAFAEEGIAQGEAALHMLADQPATASHIAFKLARHFVADEPAPSLVDTLADAFVRTAGDLKAVALALIESDEAFVDATKIKPPQLFAWSSLRALDLEAQPRQLTPVLQTLGQPMWDPPSPEGFSDESATWLAPDAMTTRLDAAELLAERANLDRSPSELIELILGADVSADTRGAILAAETRTQAVSIMLMSPEFQRI